MIQINPIANKLNSIDCLKVDFEVTELVESEAVAASLALEDIYSLIEIGTIICVNGIEFTVAQTSDYINNQIPIAANMITLLGIGLQTAMNTNFQLADKFTFDPATLTFTATDCETPIGIEFKNLSDQTTKSYTSSPTALALKEDYTICGRLICKERDEEIEFAFPVLTKVENCELIEVEACKDISALVADCLNTPLPFCDPNSLAITRPEMTAAFCIEYAEQYGGNTYGAQTSEEFTVYHSVESELDQYCEKPILVRTQEDKYCLGQCLSAYVYVEGATALVAELITKDKAGATISTITIPYYQGATYTGVIEAQIGLTQLGLQSSLSDVASYCLTFSAGSTTYEQIEINVDCCDCVEEFRFLTNLGTFEGITTDCIEDSALTSTRQFISTCEACNESNRKQVGGESYRQFTVYVKAEDYTTDFLEAFLCSSEIYWCFDDEFYAIEPLEENYTDLSKCKLQTIPFGFRIRSKKTLIQC